ncbi:hypothetical protein D046_4447B, partial [Vibrio parahaemolyticus V-223/04]
VEVAKN